METDYENNDFDILKIIVLEFLTGMKWRQSSGYHDCIYYILIKKNTTNKNRYQVTYKRLYCKLLGGDELSQEFIEMNGKLPAGKTREQ